VNDARDALEGARERHRRRSRGHRALVIAGGYAAAALGVVLVVPLPEVGLPLLVVGLRLLALRYSWAARAYLPVARLWERIKALPASVKVGLGLLVFALVAGVVWWLY
jgi:hypothetical protein